MSIIRAIVDFIVGLFRSKPVDQAKLEGKADSIKEDISNIDKEIKDIDTSNMSDKEIEDYFNK